MKASRLIIALLFILGLAAVPAFAGSETTALDSGIRFSASTLPLFSDFDADNKIDHAELFSDGAQKHIHISLGNFAWKSLSFDSGVQDPGRLMSDDIDRDGDTDILWVSQTDPRKVVLWLGDGRGNFSIATYREGHQLSALLNRDAQPRFSSNEDDEDSVCVLQATTIVALQIASVEAP